MQHRSRAVAHLIKLVDAADPVVAQHEGAGLQNQLTGFWVLHHVRRKTHGAGALPWCVLPTWNEVKHVLEQLGFAGARIAAQQDVNLGTEVSATRLGEVFTRAAE